MVLGFGLHFTRFSLVSYSSPQHHLCGIEYSCSWYGHTVLTHSPPVGILSDWIINSEGGRFSILSICLYIPHTRVCTHGAVLMWYHVIPCVFHCAVTAAGWFTIVSHKMKGILQEIQPQVNC